MPANPWLVWLTCVLAAIVVVLSVIRAPAMPVPTCEEVREHAKNSKYTIEQIRDMALRAGLTAEQFAAVKECIEGKK